MKLRAFLALALVFGAGVSQAQITWTNGAEDSSWSNPGNWSSNVVPSDGSNVVIHDQPTDDLIGVDTGGLTPIASLTFDNSLSASVELLPLASEILEVRGAIVNNDDNGHLFNIQVNAGANATYAGGVGLTFSSLNVQTFAIQTTGSITIDNKLVFNLESTSSYGRIGAADVDGAFISIASSTYSGQRGDTFQFSIGGSGFQGATLDLVLPTLSNGLGWDTSQFISHGTLVVVPEPSIWGLLGLALLVAVLFRDRNPLQLAVSLSARSKSLNFRRRG